MSFKRTDEYCDDVMQKMMDSYRTIIESTGEDPNREGLLKTPEWVSKAMQYITQGCMMSSRELLGIAKFH